MPAPIDPRVDCVFKALLGDPRHAGLLIHFLNAVLKSDPLITDVFITNPYNPQDFLNDKLTIVDIKATDQQDRVYQIELQLTLHAQLPARMLFTWSRVYDGQLGQGDDYSRLHPVIAIWIVEGAMFPASPAFHHRFSLRDPALDQALCDHQEIHVLELGKWRRSARALDEEGKWMYFFSEARAWETLPEPLDSPLMREAMEILDRFKLERNERWAYLSRLDAESLQATYEGEIRRAAEREQQLEASLQREAEARAEAERELTRLRALLAERTEG